MGEMFTERRRGLGIEMAEMNALNRICSGRAPIHPSLSAGGINRSGAIMPTSGWFHRARTSKPASCPVPSVTRGWKYGKNSPASRAWRAVEISIFMRARYAEECGGSVHKRVKPLLISCQFVDVNELVKKAAQSIWRWGPPGPYQAPFVLALLGCPRLLSKRSANARLQLHESNRVYT